MKEMTARLETDPELAKAYRAAHEDYITRRDAIEVLEGFPSAGVPDCGVPLRRVLPKAEVLTGRVTTIDQDRKVATVAPLVGEAYELPFDYLVIAMGAVCTCRSPVSPSRASA
ncbi:hypothetical protein SBADM41S_01021 [Streptomyces badius]